MTAVNSHTTAPERQVAHSADSRTAEQSRTGAATNGIPGRGVNSERVHECPIRHFPLATNVPRKPNGSRALWSGFFPRVAQTQRKFVVDHQECGTETTTLLVTEPLPCRRQCKRL